MEPIAKALVVGIATVVLVGGMYVGVRTTLDPVWFVGWRNRLNGDPRNYPVEWRSHWWAQWNMTMWNPDRAPREDLRIFGIVVTALSTVFLASLFVFAY
jgi:hypothetical protein